MGYTRQDKDRIREKSSWQSVTYQVSGLSLLLSEVEEHPQVRHVLGADNIRRLRKARERLCTAHEHLVSRMSYFGVSDTPTELADYTNLADASVTKAKMLFSDLFAHAVSLSENEPVSQDWFEMAAILSFASICLRALAESEVVQSILTTMQVQRSITSAADRVDKIRQEADTWLKNFGSKDGGYRQDIFFPQEHTAMDMQARDWLDDLSRDAAEIAYATSVWQPTTKEVITDA